MGVTGVDIEQIGEQIGEPEPIPDERAEALLAEGVSASTHGRLVELAGWWAQVRPRPGGPARVWQLGGRDDLPEAGRFELTVRALDPPRDAGDAVNWGVAMADQAADAGVDLLLLCVPDEAAAQVLAATLMELDPMDVLGWPGDGRLDDAAWVGAVAQLRDGLRGMHGLRGRPHAQVLALGSPVMAAGAGVLMQSALRRTPVILDGFGAAMCALMSRVGARAARDWWQAGQLGGQALHERALTSLRLDPLTRLGVQAEDGTGARLGLDVLLTASRLLRDA